MAQTTSLSRVSTAAKLPACLVLGAGYGAATSLINDLSSPYGALGSRLGGAPVQSPLEVVSVVLGAGWAWAALAVTLGWFIGSRARGAVAAGLGLVGATPVYYAVDHVLRDEPLTSSEIGFWAIGGMVLGSALGAIGASIRRPGIAGLLAGLTVPVGAAVQMVLLAPSVDGPQVHAEAVWARWLVLAAAAAGTAFFLARYWRSWTSDRRLAATGTAL